MALTMMVMYLHRSTHLPPGPVGSSAGLGQANLHYHLEDLENILDLLMNEKPMHLLYTRSRKREWY
jgi:hypothetical protein